MSIGQQGDKSYDIRLPKAGTVLVQSVTTAAVIDLAAAGGPASLSSGFTDNMQTGMTRPENVAMAPNQGTVTTPAALSPAGWIGHWIDITVDSGGGDLGYVAGLTNASVSGANAPVLATTGNAGTAGTCMRLAAGGKISVWVTPEERFLGVVSSGTSVVRIALSSR